MANLWSVALFCEISVPGNDGSIILCHHDRSKWDGIIVNQEMGSCLWVCSPFLGPWTVQVQNFGISILYTLLIICCNSNSNGPGELSNVFGDLFYFASECRTFAGQERERVRCPVSGDTDCGELFNLGAGNQTLVVKKKKKARKALRHWALELSIFNIGPVD